MEHGVVGRAAAGTALVLVIAAGWLGYQHTSTGGAAASGSDCDPAAVLAASDSPVAVAAAGGSAGSAAGTAEGTYPPAAAPAPDLQPLSEQQAIDVADGWLARLSGSAAQASQTVADETAYSEFVSSAQQPAPEDGRVAPSRCVWVVTATSSQPFAIHGGPYAGPDAPAPSPTHTATTVVIDAGSHIVIEATS